MRDIDFGDGVKQATTIPWGDVSTAHYTTGIPNIEVFVPLPAKQIAALRRLKYVSPLLRLRPVQSFLKSRAAARAPVPIARLANGCRRGSGARCRHRAENS